MHKSFLEKYLLSTAFYRDANNDTGAPEKTPAQLAREQIQANVNVSARSSDEGENNNDNNDGKVSEENNDEDLEEGEEEEEGKEEKEENKENETEEQKTARLAQEKEDKRQARIQKRIDKLTAESKNKDTEIERLKAQLQEQPKEGLTEEEVERRAQDKAAKALQEREAANIQKDFEKRCDVLHDAAVKLDKSFNDNVKEMAEDLGLIPPTLIYALSDLDNENGHEVLNYLAKPENIEEAEEIYELQSKPHRLTQKIIRLSDKIKAEKKPAPRRQSAVPAPVTPVGEGANRQTNVLPKDPTKNMDDFIRIRNKQSEEFRKSRGR